MSKGGARQRALCSVMFGRLHTLGNAILLPFVPQDGSPKEANEETTNYVRNFFDQTSAIAPQPATTQHNQNNLELARNAY